MSTFQRPASRPYFLVISSAEEDGVLTSSVFSFTALTLKLLKWHLRDWNEENLEALYKETEEEDGINRVVVIVEAIEEFSTYQNIG